MSIQTRINMNGIWRKVEKKGLSLVENECNNGYWLKRGETKIARVTFTASGDVCIFPFAFPGKMYSTLRNSDKW